MRSKIVVPSSSTASLRFRDHWWISNIVDGHEVAVGMLRVTELLAELQVWLEFNALLTPDFEDLRILEVGAGHENTRKAVENLRLKDRMKGEEIPPSPRTKASYCSMFT